MELMAQVECAIDIFEAKTNGLAQGLFMFDNVLGHMKRASDAITAKGMVKGASQFVFFVCVFKASKCPVLNGPCMCDGINHLTGMPQAFYFSDDHPLYPG